MKVILCGYHWIGCEVLETLVKSGHDVFVYTHESPHHIPSLIGLCNKLEIPFSLCNISETELPFEPDIICSIYYRYIIKKHVIDSCNGKIFNLHPSLLPKYRGCSSLTWAIINGEKEAGFSYHYIDEGCDTGPIIIQKPVTIQSWDTQMTLYNRVMFESAKYFTRAFNLVVRGYPGKPQKGLATFYRRGCPHKGVIDLKWDIDYIERFIRAMCHPPYPPAKLYGKEVLTLDDFIRFVEDLEDK